MELHVVPDTAAKLAAAEEALDGGRRAGRGRGRSSPRCEHSVESLNARRLQLQGEADELRRRLAAIEDDVDQVDDDLEEAEETREDAAGVLAEARRAPETAEAGVTRLRG